MYFRGVRAVDSPTLGQFRAYADSAPSRLRLWGFPGDELEMVLRTSHVAHAATVKRAHDPHLVPRLSRSEQDAEGALIRWCLARERSREDSHDLAEGPSRAHMAWAREAIDLAKSWAPLETALILAEHEHKGFESKGRLVRFPYMDDPRYEALDRRIGRPFALAPDLSSTAEHMSLLREWAGRQEIGSFPDMSDREFSVAIRMARALRSQNPREIEPSTVVNGFSLTEAHAVWDVLHAWAFVSSIMTMASLDPRAALLTPTAATLVTDLSKNSGVTPDAVREVVKMLTYRHGYHPDPAIAPLVSREDRILIPPLLVTTSNFERNLLRVVALDPSLQGPIGDARGRVGTQRVAGLLATIPGVEVATNLEVRGQGHRDLGDLDVIALDLTARIGAILEVKWPAPPDHIIEILRLEEMLETAMERSARRKALLDAGEASIRSWPPYWPPYHDVQWRWMVLVKDHLPYAGRLRRHELTPTSWELLWVRCSDTLPGTLRRLELDYDLPEEGVDFWRVWRRASLAPYRVEIEGIELAPREGDPRDLSGIPAGS